MGGNRINQFLYTSVDFRQYFQVSDVVNYFELNENLVINYIYLTKYWVYTHYKFPFRVLLLEYILKFKKFLFSKSKK